MGVVIALILIVVVVWWLNRRDRQLPGLANLGKRQGYPNRDIPPHLMRQLDRLTRDRRVSLRLIERVEFSNPGRSKRWCVEKAIYDIQRDRRS